MTHWWKFEKPDVTRQFTRNIRGTQVSVLPSPYDVPELFRSYLDSQENRFIIEFKYIDDEPLVPSQSSEVLRFWLGRNSGRVYRIDTDARTLADPTVRAQLVERVSSALERLERAPKTEFAKANYEFVRLGMLERQNAILESIQH